MEQVYYYDTKVTWAEGRKGNLSSPGMDTFEVATPPEFKGGVPNIWSPEHLFVSSANVCLMTTFLAIAENSKLEFESYSCGAKGKLEKKDGIMQITEITLTPELKVKEEKDIERGTRILEKAEKHCLISNSMKSEIVLKPVVTAG